MHISRGCTYRRNDRLNQEQEILVPGDGESSTNNEGTGDRHHLGQLLLHTEIE